MVLMLTLPPDRTIYEFVGVILMYVVVLAHIGMGGIFFRSASKVSKGTDQEHIDRGYGYWFVSIGLGYLMYALDKTWRFFYDRRLFTKYTDDRLLNSDYFVAAFIFLFISFVFLSVAIEKYGLGKKNSVLSYLSGAIAVFLIVFRPIENLFLDTNNPPGIISHILSIIVYLAIAIVYIRILQIYILLLRDLPQGTVLRRKTIVSVLGIVLWSGFLAGGANSVEDFGLYGPIIAPICFLVILGILYWGFSRKN
jgi:hypothetical protein